MITEVSAGGVVFNDKEILVLQKQSGEWVMPKGHVEPDETPEEAAVREVFEETGLTAMIICKIGQTRYPFFTSAGEQRQKVVHWFAMCLDGPAEKLHVEPIFLEGRFIPLEFALNALTFENDKEIARRAITERAKGLHE